MSKTIKAIVYERHGNPAEVLQIQTQPWPKPAAAEAIVAMRAAPINPADINAIEGKYPGRREVPAVPGFEGAGVVVEVSADVSTITKGALVILPHNIGTWQEALAVKVVDEDHLTPVAAGGDMIERAREFQSKRPCHTETLARKRRVAQDVAARIRVSDSDVVM